MSVRLVSTRGGPAVDMPAAVLAGLAPDGGLYVPEEWPRLDPAGLDAGSGFTAVATAVLGLFTSDLLPAPRLERLVGEAFARFDHPEVAPLVELGQDLYLMELFWGPTLAFKDFALQVLGRLVDVALGESGGNAMILGATSGDTGSAAMEAFRDRERVDVVILFPEGRTTEVQRRQMTTIEAPNVHAVAVEGTFDDCQDLVKGVFADPGAREDLSLSTANSINFGRLITQVAYYYWAVARLGGPVSFAVPSGNFGNVYSGYAATRMGLPVQRLIVGSNANNVLDGFFRDGRLDLGTVIPTLSPSMDIQVPSNLERLLFDLFRRDGERLMAAMIRLREKGSLAVTAGTDDLFVSRWYDDEDTMATMRQVYRSSGRIVDPHSAVGIAAARDTPTDGPVVCLATAHPAKFADAVESALGRPSPVPPALEGIHDRPERVTRIPRDLGAIHRLLRERSRFA
ncbi:MAG: threonine synthase [bacterium]|nr:threonine synthase [bacterium]